VHGRGQGTIKSSYAQLRFHAILAEIERTGESFTITQRERPVAVLMPARRHRRFGQLPGMHVPDDAASRGRNRDLVRQFARLEPTPPSELDTGKTSL
jgi:antitoxin (DNA-binding transcriptional repressor) of toxin-antitoxin stability system